MKATCFERPSVGLIPLSFGSRTHHLLEEERSRFVESHGEGRPTTIGAGRSHSAAHLSPMNNKNEPAKIYPLLMVNNYENLE